MTNQQRRVLEIVRAIDDTGVFALAGGGAINAHHVADRETHDLDLFTPALDKINDIDVGPRSRHERTRRRQNVRTIRPR